MGWLKNSLLATAMLALAACAASPQAGPQADPSQAVAPTSDAIREALARGDLDKLVRAAEIRLAQGENSQGALVVASLNAFAKGDLAEARRLHAQLGAADALAIYLGAFITAAEGDVERAIFRIEDARGLQPEQRDRALALLHEASGHPERALALHAKLERALPPPPKRDGDFEATLENVTASLQAWRSAELLFRRALLEQRAGDREAAAASFARVLRYAPNDLQTLAALEQLRQDAAPLRGPLNAREAFARVLMELADSSGAADFIVASLVQNPDLLQQVRLQEVLRLFAQRMDPNALDLRLMVADDLGQRRAFAAQLSLLEAKAEWGPYAGLAAARRAEALRRLDRRNEALALARKTVERHAPLRLHEAFALGEVLNRLDRFDDALAVLDPATLPQASEDDRADLHSARGAVQRRAGRMDAAISDLRAAVAAGGERRDMRSFLASILSEHPPTWAEGIALHRQLLLEREDASSLNALAWGLLQNPAKGLEEAHKLVVRSVAIAPNHYPAVDTLGWSYYLHGDFLTARREIARALDLAGEDAPAELHDHLGDIYWRLERQEDAREAWRAALQANPDQIQQPAIEAKLRDGLLTPAPERKEPPVVSDPLAPPPPKSEI